MALCRCRLYTDLLAPTIILVVLSGISNGSPPLTPYILLQEKDNGGSIQVRISQTLLIQVSRQLGTGYSWSPTLVDESVWKATEVGPEELKLLSDRGVLAPRKGPNLPGSAEQQVFRFQPLSEKTSRIELTYARPWERGKPGKTFSVNVRVMD